MEDPLNQLWSTWRVNPCGTIAVDRARLEEPNFNKVMKWYDDEHRYMSCSLMICTVPQSVRNLQVFGLFVVDVAAVERHEERPIEQDYLVRSTRGGHAIYYSGQPKDHPLRQATYWQDLDSFCERVGKTGEYGCSLSGKHWWVPDHHLSVAAPLFDSRPEIRTAIDAAMAEANIIIDLWRMGAMPRPAD